MADDFNFVSPAWRSDQSCTDPLNSSTWLSLRHLKPSLSKIEVIRNLPSLSIPGGDSWSTFFITIATSLVQPHCHSLGLYQQPLWESVYSCSLWPAFLTEARRYFKQCKYDHFPGSAPLPLQKEQNCKRVWNVQLDWAPCSFFCLTSLILSPQATWSFWTLKLLPTPSCFWVFTPALPSSWKVVRPLPTSPEKFLMFQDCLHQDSTQLFQPRKPPTWSTHTSLFVSY